MIKMKNIEEKLINELKEEGASEKETEELFSILNRLNKFSELKLSEDKKREFLEKINKKEIKASFFWRAFFIPSLTFAVLLVLISTPLVLAQKSLPGEALYPLKKISENAAVIIKPQVKEDVVVRRSEEVKKLVEEKKEQKIIKEALKEYKKEAREVKKENRRKEKIEKSLEHLKQAREKTEDENKEEIEEAIKEIEENQREIEDIKEEIKGKMDFKEKIRIKIEDD